MSDAETKGNHKEIPPVPKGVVSGTEGRQRQGPGQVLYSAAKTTLRELKRKNRPYLLKDPKGFRKIVLRAVSRVLKLKPGPRKKHDPNVAAAARKRRAGADWKDLYPIYIPEYDRLTEYTKALAEDGFRKKIYAYTKAHPPRRKRHL